MKNVFLLFGLIVAVTFSSCSEDDKTPPVITLKGELTMDIPITDKYTEPGYAAFDNADGDITPFVAIKGQVNENVAKTYVLTYKVSDKAGNFAVKTRTINIVQ